MKNQNNFSSKEELLQYIDAGIVVYWGNDNYVALKDNIGQYLLESLSNEHFVGLLNSDGELSEFELSDFYIKVVEYHRPPTELEVKLGYGATHYRDFPVDLVIKKDGELKKWFICKDMPLIHCDGLRYNF